MSSIDSLDAAWVDGDDGKWCSRFAESGLLARSRRASRPVTVTVAAARDARPRRAGRPLSSGAAIGFRAKTGRAIAVALSGTAARPALVWRREISLVDPAIAETAFPYHATMELPWDRAVAATEPFVRAIESVAIVATGGLIDDLESQGLVVRAIGIVGSVDRDLAKLGSRHMRAHAAEGILFRRVLESAAAKRGLRSLCFGEKTLQASAIEALKIKASKLQSQLKEFGVEAGSPWRSDQKAAATAAWIAMSVRR